MSVKEYKEYSYVLLKLWMANLITDGEYNRIMDRVNADWRRTEGADDEDNWGSQCASSIIRDAPTIKTKQIKYYDEDYYDEDENVWKIGEVIVDE